MSEFFNNTENIPESLKTFRDKMWELKRAEEENLLRTGHGPAHFQMVNPDELTDEDARLYEKYIGNALTKEEYKKHRNQFSCASMEDSRHGFCAYVGNKLAVRFLQEEIGKKTAQESANDEK
ncbi:MAG: hypothetical protein AAB362_00810 [Patescibacteria group bacterium]